MRSDSTNAQSQLDRDGVVVDLYLERHHRLPLSYAAVLARSIECAGLRFSDVPDPVASVEGIIQPGSSLSHATHGRLPLRRGNDQGRHSGFLVTISTADMV